MLPMSAEALQCMEKQLKKQSGWLRGCFLTPRLKLDTANDNEVETLSNNTFDLSKVCSVSSISYIWILHYYNMQSTDSVYRFDNNRTFAFVQDSGSQQVMHHAWANMFHQLDLMQRMDDEEEIHTIEPCVQITNIFQYSNAIINDVLNSFAYMQSITKEANVDDIKGVIQRTMSRYAGDIIFCILNTKDVQSTRTLLHKLTTFVNVHNIKFGMTPKMTQKIFKKMKTAAISSSLYSSVEEMIM